MDFGRCGTEWLLGLNANKSPDPDGLHPQGAGQRTVKNIVPNLWLMACLYSKRGLKAS